MLQVENLRGWYGKTQALFDVSLTVSPGRVLALVGTNGAGKSTTVRSILGLIRSEGRITCCGEDISGLPAHQRVRRHRLAVVHESQNLFGELTVAENLFMGMPKEAADRLDEVVSVFPVIAERQKERVSSLSGGQRQMVAIGRTMLADPDYIILDEPTLGLSPAMVDEIYAAVAKLANARCGVLLIEQNLYRAASVADELQLVSIGRSSPPVPAGDTAEVQRLQEIAFGMRS